MESIKNRELQESEIVAMNKFAIYTVITGGYEDVLQPLVIDDRFDYILFTDKVNTDKEGAWAVRKVPEIHNLDKIRLSRYPKTHPANLLSEYEASLYLDANIQIKDNWIYSRFIELVNAGVEYAGVKLVVTGRDCIYDHAFDMCSMHVEHDYTGIKQCHELYLRHFPQHFGLNENNMIFRRHTEKVKKVDDEWWEWILNYSCRDQFSYMYCLWKNKIPINYLLPEGEDARNSRHFNFVVHNNKPNVSKRKIKKKSLIEKIRLLALSYNKQEGLRIWEKSYKSNKPVSSLYLQSYLILLKNFPSLINKCIETRL